ncbi:MAG: hypothetical protein H0X30_08865 [Anaerolineae bacterium]|nr:hypothetical protein [Anaerolineae bacterium]
MEKNVNYYMSLPYPILLIPAFEHQKHFWYAQIPAWKGFMVDSATLEEVLKTLEEVKEEWIEWHLEDGMPIAEPESITA